MLCQLALHYCILYYNENDNNNNNKKKKNSDKSYVTLDHKTSLKSLGYICSNSQKYIVWVKFIHFSFMPKIIRILSKDHVP